MLDGVRVPSRRGRQRAKANLRKATAAVRNGIDEGSLTNVEVVSPLSLDDQAERRVESFLRRQAKKENREATREAAGTSPGALAASKPSVEVVTLPHSNVKRAFLRFAVDGHDVVAVGQAPRKKVARTLCLMHAAKLIDHFSVDTPEGTPPVPLVEGHSHGRPQAPRVPSDPRDRAAWDAYIAACAVYTKARAESIRAHYLHQLRIPPSGNPLVDRAAAMVERGGAPRDPTPLQTLNNMMHDAPHAMRVTSIPSPRAHVAMLPLDTESNLVATGVARNSRQAKARCALHALCVLQLMREAQKSGGASGGVPDASTGSASFDAVVQSLRPRFARLYAFFCFLFGEEKTTVRFTKNGGAFVCHLTLGEVGCEGRGINRFEAERAAVETALSELELYDARVAALNTFLARFPGLTSPTGIPTAQLPEALRVRIQKCVSDIQSRFPSSFSSSSSVAPAASSSSLGVEEGVGAGWEDEPDGVLHSGDTGVLPSENPPLWAATATTRHARRAPNPRYAEELRQRLLTLHTDSVYLRRFHPRRSTLAMASVKDAVLEAVQSHRVTVVCGTTGCGKTTQVPQYLLDSEILAGRGDECRILVTQPRRISAFSVAERIAQERLSEVGTEVGYAVRLDSKPGRHITLCTSGVLLQMLSENPDLADVSYLVVDEVHERDINCDVILALVKQILPRNPRLRVLLMSATMQSELFAQYFDGTVPVIQVDGAVYPVKEYYLEDVALFATKPGGALRPCASPMFDIVERLARGAQRGGVAQRLSWLTTPQKTDYQLIAYLVYRSVVVDMQGEVAGKSILVFLPGWKELLAAKQAIEELSGGGQGSAVRFHIILLHSTVETAKQRECFQPAPPGTVKVVLATNIAESGITIDDAAVVIDTGLIKQTTWSVRGSGGSSHEGNVEAQGYGSSSTTAPNAAYATQLTLGYASRANCTQRRGRAGRTQGGVCYRLFSRATWDAMRTFQEAEIHRVPLTQVLLKLLSLGYAQPKQTLTTFIEPPSTANVEASMALLKNLGAVTAEEALTPLGMYLSKLPCDPRIGKMVMMGAVLQCLDSVLTVAAAADVCPFVSSREVAAEVRQRRYLLARESESDQISYLNAFNAYCANRESWSFAQHNYLHVGNLGTISKYKWQYLDILCTAGFISREDYRASAEPVGQHRYASTSIPLGSNQALVEYMEDGEDGADAALPYDGSLCIETSVLSSDARDVSLVKACVCAALFPNVAMLAPPSLLRPEKTRAKLQLRTKTHTAITPANDSVCQRIGGPRAHGMANREEVVKALSTPRSSATSPAMLYVYEDVFSVRESKKEYLTEVSSISLWALLLFGAAETNWVYDDLLGLGVVDGWIAVRVDVQTFNALRDLRRTLHECVWRKYQDPTNRDNNTAIHRLRALSKAVLKAPANAEEDPEMHRLVDSGVIVSPTGLCEPPASTVSEDREDGWMEEEEEEEEAEYPGW